MITVTAAVRSIPGQDTLLAVTDVNLLSNCCCSLDEAVMQPRTGSFHSCVLGLTAVEGTVVWMVVLPFVVADHDWKCFEDGVYEQSLRCVWCPWDMLAVTINRASNALDALASYIAVVIPVLCLSLDYTWKKSTIGLVQAVVRYFIREPRTVCCEARKCPPRAEWSASLCRVVCGTVI